MTDTDFAGDARAFWNQLCAIDLCIAVNAGADAARDQIIAEVTAAGEADRLVAGLVWAANTLAKTVADQHASADERPVWEALAGHARTGLHASHELSRLTENKEGNETP